MALEDSFKNLEIDMMKGDPEQQEEPPNEDEMVKRHPLKKKYKLKGLWGGGGFQIDDEESTSEDETEKHLMHSKFTNKDRFGYEIERNEMQNPYSQAQLNISDGVGYASCILPKEILDELWQFKN
jgi:hypothetical protein